MYKGRFAPTPSGHLHFGSLVTAVGSYLRARSKCGFWFLRIEDVDGQRSKPEYTDSIIKTLEEFSLNWDGDILVQSKRSDYYQEILNKIISQERAYGCSCTRALIKKNNFKHPLECRLKKAPIEPGKNVRFYSTNLPHEFTDNLLGKITFNSSDSNIDFILKRGDGFFAYNLASVTDDIFSGVTEIVRGQDLLYDTFAQEELRNVLNASKIDYLHLPLALQANNLKLSKQNHAEPVNIKDKSAVLVKTLEFLGQVTNEEEKNFLKHESTENIISYAVKHFDLNKIPHEGKIVT